MNTCVCVCVCVRLKCSFYSPINPSVPNFTHDFWTACAWVLFSQPFLSNAGWSWNGTPFFFSHNVWVCVCACVWMCVPLFSSPISICVSLMASKSSLSLTVQTEPCPSEPLKMRWEQCWCYKYTPVTEDHLRESHPNHACFLSLALSCRFPDKCQKFGKTFQTRTWWEASQ